ncbi:MAG: hypothetical protein WAL83_15555 [Arenicellales bacterium]
MLWIILVIAAGLLTGWLIISYGYRHSILIVLVLLAAAATGLVWHIRFGQQAGTGLLGPDDVHLNNLEMTRQYRTSYRMTARLVNTSAEFTLRSLKVTITASDCKNAGADCIVVGEDQRTVTEEIPPGQARDIVEQYVFPRFVLQGELKWRYRISEVKATHQ